MANKIKKHTKEGSAKKLLFSLLLLLVILIFTISFVSAENLLYLKGDGAPLASLSQDPPTSTTLPNYDPGRNDFPGLLIERGGNGMFETDPFKYQQWLSSPNGMTIDGPASVIFWSAMKNFGTDNRGIVEAFLLDCDAGGFDCSLIAQNQKDIFNWSGGYGSFHIDSIEFGDLSYTVPDGRSLAIRFVVGADSDDDMWFAYDTESYASRLTDSAASDIVVDCDFSDWCDGQGTEFCIADQGGPNDWGSPAKLDITELAISSNLIDSFHLLVGFDDDPPQDTTAATLIDTDLDGKINFAFVATLDGSSSSLELYSCDDTIADGCESALFERSYPSTYYCAASSQGPWDNDSLVEMALPIHDLNIHIADPVVISTLISYAASALLTSPKDSILGFTEQNYIDGIYYDTESGRAKLVRRVGSYYVIRRHTDPSSVRTTEAHATVLRAPFDDLPGSLDDGLSYFYVIEKEGGLPVDLSVQSNSSDNAIRLGFDDGNTLSAPVDSSLSTVTLDKDSSLADGVSTITVSIVPRDSKGTLIGSGCNVEVDEIQLSPGSLTDPVKDNHDGSYTFEVASINHSVSNIVVTVEGIELDSQPQITFLEYLPDMMHTERDQDMDSAAGPSNTVNHLNGSSDAISKESIDDHSKSGQNDHPMTHRSHHLR